MRYSYNKDDVDAVEKIEVNSDMRTIEIKLPAYVLEKNGKGKIYISTWDFDGLENSYRKIETDAKEYKFGGGNESSNLVMDETEVIEIE